MTAPFGLKSKGKSQKSKVIYQARNRSQASPKAGEKKLKILKREREARIFNQSILNPLPKREMVKLLTFDF